MNWLERIEESSARERKLLILSSVMAVLVALSDQVTKWFFVLNYKLGESSSLIPGFLNFTYVRNLGAAWSVLSGKVWLLFITGLAAAAAIIWYFRKLAEGCAERYFALMLVLGGIAGNSFDRAFHGAVVDFIHVHYYNIWHYPIFNVADISICCGVGIFLISSFFRKPQEKQNG